MIDEQTVCRGGMQAPMLDTVSGMRSDSASDSLKKLTASRKIATDYVDRFSNSYFRYPMNPGVFHQRLKEAFIVHLVACI